MATPCQTYNLQYQSGGDSEASIQLFNHREFVASLTFQKDGSDLPPNVAE